MSEVEKLVEKWRSAAKVCGAEGDDHNRGMAFAMRCDANELEAAIAADKQAQPSGEVSDAMVERAVVAFWSVQDGTDKQRLRAALTAASKGSEP